MFAHAGLSGGQSGFGVKRGGAVPRVHLRGGGDRDIEQVVGHFLTCRSGEWESIQHAFRFAIRAVAPLQLSASVYRVALWKQSPFAFFESAAATGVAGAVFAVGLPSTIGALSLRVGLTQTFRAP